jgi:hypothetical protein
VIVAVVAAAVMTLAGAAAPDPVRQDARPREIRGAWSATSGARVFFGTWTATLDPDAPDQAQGTWTLLEGRRIVLDGTWAASKAGGAWRGAWSARVASQRGGGDGRPDYTGTWQATIADSAVETLAGMLASTLADDVTGTWRAGAASGGWRLTARR